MLKLSPFAPTPFCAPAMEVNGLYFVKAPGDKFLSIYARYKGSCNWIPLHIGLPAIQTLQQVRDADRNISLGSGSYEDAHFYLRSAEGNNTTAAYYVNGDGAAIQAGNTSGYAAVNLQPLGGMLFYRGLEVATKSWVQGAGLFAPIAHVGAGGNAHALATGAVAGFMSAADKTKLTGLTQGITVETDPTVPAHVKAITTTDISNWNAKENAANKSTATGLGTSNTLFPTQNAVKAYVDNSITANNTNYIPTTQKGAVNGVASLGADGKIPNGQLPSLAITETFVVASQAAMLALSQAGTGDIAVRTDLNKSFILTNNTPGQLSSWQELLSPTISNTDQVPEGAVNLYFTQGRARASVSAGTGITYNNTTGVITNSSPNLPSNLALGTRTTTTVAVTNSDGTGFTIPIATTALAGLQSAADKAKLDGLSNYILPIATGSVLGGVKVGSGLAINATTGVLSATNTNVGTVTSVTAGAGMNFSAVTSAGPVTLGTPSPITTTSTDEVTANSHTHSFEPGGTEEQYISGAGTLTNFPEIPTDTDYVTTNTNQVNLSGDKTWDGIHAFNNDIKAGIGSNQIIVGAGSGSENTLLGKQVGTAFTATALWNVAVGSQALRIMAAGRNNTAVGEVAMNAWVSDSTTLYSNNTAIGNSAMYNVSAGVGNTTLGASAGASNALRSRGNYNVMLGDNAGSNSVTGTTPLGSYNIFIGRRAGYNELGSYKLIIGVDTHTSTAIISGDMSAKTLAFDAATTINTLAGSDTRMVTASSSGLLSTAAIPAIPTVNNGTLTLTTTGIANGSQTFSANQATNATFTVNVPGTNLGTSTNWGEITSSTGTGTTLQTLGRTNITDGNETPATTGFNPTFNTTGSTNYPSAAGGGFRYIRSASTALGSFSMWTGNAGSDDVWYKTGLTTGTWNSWVRIASKEWVNAQGYTNNAGTVTSVAVGNGLTGTSPITTSGTITLGTPGSITLTTTNTVSSTSHTHAITGVLSANSLIAGGTTTINNGVDADNILLSGMQYVGNGGSSPSTNIPSGDYGFILSNIAGGSGMQTFLRQVNGDDYWYRKRNGSAWDIWYQHASRQWVSSQGYTSNAGTVTSIAATIAGAALNITGSPITGAGTLGFTWGGTASQYVNGAGGLTTFPAIPAAANNGALTLATSGIATGSATFTANQATNGSFTVSVPGTNIGASLSGTTLTITSSTGSSGNVNLSTLIPEVPDLQQVTDLGNTSTNDIHAVGGTGGRSTRMTNGGYQFLRSSSGGYAGGLSLMNSAGTTSIAGTGFYGGAESFTYGYLSANASGGGLHDAAILKFVDGKVGIGISGLLAPTSNHMFEVNGTTLSNDYQIHTKAGSGTIIKNGIAAHSVIKNPVEYNSPSSGTAITGHILIKHAPNANATMFEMCIKMYGYNNNWAGELNITFYQQSASVINAITRVGYLTGNDNTAVTLLADNPDLVRVGFDSSGNLTIALGAVGYNWNSYVRFVIDEIRTSHTGGSNAAWRDGWSIETSNTALTGYTSLVSIPVTRTISNADAKSSFTQQRLWSDGTLRPNTMTFADTRSTNEAPSFYFSGLTNELKQTSVLPGITGGTYASMLTVQNYGDSSAGMSAGQLAFTRGGLWHRDTATNTTWSSNFKRLAYADELNSGTVTSVNVAGSGALTFSGGPVTIAGVINANWSGTAAQYVRGDGSLAAFPAVSEGTVTSVAIAAPSAFTVSGSPVTGAGTITLAGAGTGAQYIRGDGTLAAFPAIPAGTVTSVTVGNGLTGTSPITTAGTITLGTPGSTTLSSTNAVTASSHTHAFTPGGTAAQYINGAGTLVTFPTIPGATDYIQNQVASPQSAGFWVNSNSRIVGNTSIVRSLDLGTTANGLDNGGILNYLGAGGTAITSIQGTYVTGNHGKLSFIAINAGTAAAEVGSFTGTTFRVNGLAGSGTRMVTADASGNLGISAIPTGTVTSVAIGNGLSGTSPITGSGTVTLGTPSAITLSSTNSVTASSHTHAFTPGGTTAQYIRGDGSLATFPTTSGTVTSVGLTAPAAFTVSGSPVTGSGSLSFTGAGTALQYIDGTGALQAFPNIITTRLRGTASGTFVSGDITLLAGTNVTVTQSSNNITISATNTTYTGSTSIALAFGSFQRAALTGDVTAAANSNATTIASNVVTYAKMQQVPTGTLTGRFSAGTGNLESLSVGDGLLMDGATLRSNRIVAGATLDFPLISGVGASASLDVTVSGAIPGDVVALGLPVNAGNSLLQFKAFVHAPNTVRIMAINYMNTAVDLPAETYRINVFK